MKKRVISAIIFGLIFFPAVYFGGMNTSESYFGFIYFLIFTLFCGYVGTFELMNMFYKKSQNLKIMRFIVPVFSCILIWLIQFSIGIHFEAVSLLINPNNINVENMTSSAVIFSGFGNWALLFLVLYLLFNMIFLLFPIFKKEGSAFDAIACITSLLYGGILLGFAFSIEYLFVNGERGWKLFAYVYSIVCFTDIFAYVIGSKFGKHKLCPHISPKKSVEGAIFGGLIGAIVGTVVACLSFMIGHNLTSYGIFEIILFILIIFVLSIIISCVAQLGDLVASKFKRTYEIKDFGNIMPGHGGVMDRFDSFILSGSFTFVLYVILLLCLAWRIIV